MDGLDRVYSQFSERVLAELVDGGAILNDHFGEPQRENGGCEDFRRYHFDQVVKPCGSDGNENGFHRPADTIVLGWSLFSGNLTATASS